MSGDHRDPNRDRDAWNIARALVGVSIPIVMIGGYAHMQTLAALAAALLAVALWSFSSFKP